MADDENPLIGTEELTGDQLRAKLMSTDYTNEDLREQLIDDEGGTAYSSSQIQMFQDVENEKEGQDYPRSGATEVFDRAFNTATQGPDEGGAVEAEADRETQTATTADTESVSEAESVHTGDADTPDAEVDGDRDVEMSETDDASVQTTDGTDAVSPVEDDAILRSWNGGGATGPGSERISLPSPYGPDAPETLLVVVPKAMGFAGVTFDKGGTFEIPYAMPNESDFAGMRVKTDLETASNVVRLSEDDPEHPDYEEDTEPAGEVV